MANGHGGARPGAGRRPYPVAPEKSSNEDKRKRTEAVAVLADVSKLSAPSYLSPLAKKEWRRIMKLYKQMDVKILCDLDVAALVMYCEAWSIYKVAQEQWTKLQVVATTNKASQQVINTCIDTMNKQATVVSRLSEQLYLTPAGRARMGVTPRKKKKDELLEFLNN